ncbi:aldo/keto reductase [Stenomitos frigidus]|uniref:NADP-dependent oxidoreductase domain-containing protein n=1 Tax=Stenomitos frigidus ULC18 TaxID=2107698 RepID=A0A2T1ES86_9CYAN|nr:aldo/keto reductase [Stenomitos frigidus]PSB35571.1 hypothetical protein C7B82_00825 [Stenomitos frigidus ULC18]
MEYRILGGTNLKVSAIAVGTWQLSGPINLDGKADGFPVLGREQAIRLIHACEDLGINLIDAAEIYGAMGEGECRVGAALQDRRDRWFVSSKFGLRQGTQGERVINCRPETIRTSLEGSLQRLQTDYLDFYLYHSPPESTWMDAGKDVLETLKQEGKIRFYGISTDDDQLLEQLARRHAVEVVLFSQSLLTHNPKLMEVVQTYNLGGMVRGVFEAGLLSGKYFHQKQQVSRDDIRQSWWDSVATERYAVYETLIPEGFSMSAFALRYVLDFATTHTVVLGSKTISEYQNALRAFDLPPLDANTHQAVTQLRQTIQKQPLKRRVMNRLKRLLPMSNR